MDGVTLEIKPTSMKKLLLLLTIFACFACKDGKESAVKTSEEIYSDTISVDTLPPGDIQEERDAMLTEKNLPEPNIEPISLNYGKYRKLIEDVPSTDCSCDCIEVSYDYATEWCIDKDKMYMTARCEKTGDNTAEVYFVSAGKQNSKEKTLPWNEFDTTTPVATLTFQSDGSAELDWLGFSSNGEVITEYALFGKKTLEGIYKKE